MKLYWTALTGICSAIALPAAVRGSVVEYSFADRVNKADLIVEGIVEAQWDIPYDRENVRDHTKKSSFRVEKVFKGEAPSGELIELLTHMNFVCDTSRKILTGKRYLVMVQRQGTAYVDVNYGRGMWEIVKLGPERTFMVGELWRPTWGCSYEDFLGTMEWHRTPRPTWPPQPKLLRDEAKVLAERALKEAGIDLAGFRFRKGELLTIGSDIEGVARKGDPMWLFDWDTPAARERSPRPPGTFAYCYVHAHTGAFHGTRSKRSLPTLRICQLFLKTYPRFRTIYEERAETMAVRKIREEEFRELLPHFGVKFLQAKSAYPEGTTYWRAEVPKSVNESPPPAIFVLEDRGRVAFVGSLAEGAVATR